MIGIFLFVIGIGPAVIGGISVTIGVTLIVIEAITVSLA